MNIDIFGKKLFNQINHVIELEINQSKLWINLEMRD